MEGISICVCVYNRPDYLKDTIEGVVKTTKGPFELIIIDDNSPDPGVQEVLNETLQNYKGPGVIRTYKNETNLKHAASQCKAFSFAKYDILVHLEADCIMIVDGWDEIMKGYFDKYPEVGQLGPTGAVRGDVIKRDGYIEGQWMLGGMWAVRREVYEKIGGWDKHLVHQIECDYCMRVRMAGYRVASIPTGVQDVQYIHLGEGDYTETPERQALLHEGVFNFIKKWNMRFNGFNDYNGIFSNSWDDMPINEIFRRQTMACLGLNKDVKQTVLPNDKEGKEFGWGKWDLILITRPPNREQEESLAQLVRDNKVFKTEGSLLANNADKPFIKLLEGRELDCNWIYVSEEVLKKLDELGIDYGR